MIRLSHVLICILCGLSSILLAQTGKNDSELLKQSMAQFDEAFQERSTDKLISLLSQHPIFMPEYQPTLNGSDEISAHFETLFARQKASTAQFEQQELHDLGDIKVEIGRFNQSLHWQTKQEAVTYEGKYWRIWLKQGQTFRLKTFAFGFFEAIEQPALWVSNYATRSSLSPSLFKAKFASMELKALHALGERGVKEKNGELRASLYTEDAIFYPYADKPQEGIKTLIPYFKAYSSHDAIIDSVQTHTHDLIYLEQHVLQYTKFAVAWRYDDMPGQSNGKGLIIRKRDAQGQLKIYRQLGLHNHSF